MKFKIRTKLISAFFAMLVPFVIVFIANYFFATKIHKSIHISANISYEMENLGDLQLELDRLLMPANDYIITADPKERVEFNRLAGEVEKHLALIPREKRCQQCHQERTAEMVAGLYGREASKDLPGEMLILKEIRDKFEGIKKYGAEIFGIEKPVGSAAAARLMKEMDALGHKVIDGPIGRHRQLVKKDMQEADEASEKSWHLFLLIRTLGYLTALIIGVVIVLIYSGRLVSVIKLLHKGSDSIAGGDFKARLDIKTGDELEQLAKAMNGMAAQLDTLYSTLEQKVEERTRELKDSERKISALLNAIPDMLFIVSKDGTFLDFRQAKDFAPSVSANEFLGRKIQEVLPAEVAAPAMFHIEKALQNNAIECFEYRLPNPLPDDKLYDYEARVAVVEEGKVIVLVRDITERKQTEEKIKKQLDYLERFQKVALRREFRIKELTTEIEKLKAENAEQ